MIKLHNGIGRLADIAAIHMATGMPVAELEQMSTWELAWKRKDLELGVTA